MENKKFLLIGMGGTIAMVRDVNRVLRPAMNVDELAKEIPFLGSGDLELEQLTNKDSTNLTPADWTQLIMRLMEAQDRYDGVLVTHGTDTMAYTASAIAMALGNAQRIPVVFTGAQLPVTDPGTDARLNAENALRTLRAAAQARITETMVVFGERILWGARSIKVHDARYLAFDSPAAPHLGLIDATGIHFSVLAHRRQKGGPGDINPHFQRDIMTAEVVPGLEPMTLLSVLRSGHCKGLVLKSLGAGNVPDEGEYSLIPVIKEAARLHIPVLVCTRFVGGNVHMDIYGPGKAALDAGAISAGDLTDVAAQVKLMMALARGYALSSALAKFISTPLASEITPATAAKAKKKVG